MFDSLYIGPLRILLLIVFVYFFGKKALNFSLPKNILSYFVNEWLSYIAIFYLIIVLLQQLEYYDLFTILLIIFLTAIVKVLGIELKQILLFRQTSNAFLIKLVKELEANYKPILFKNDQQKHYSIYNPINLILINIVIVLVVLMYFLQYDIYSSTYLWFKDLVKIYNFNNQLWFTTNHVSLGDFPLISMYVKLTGISIEMGLRTFGVLELLIIAVLLFWYVQKCISKSYIFSTLAMLSIISFFVFVPINIKIMTMHNSLMFAFTILIPLMVHITDLTNKTKIDKHFFIKFGTIFLALFFIDFFVTTILLPIYFICVLIYAKEYRILFKVFGIYLVTNLMGGLYVWSIKGDALFIEYIKANLVSIESFMDFEQLLLPWSQLSIIYLSLIIFILLSAKIFTKRIHLRRSVKTGLTFVGILLALLFVKHPILDADLITNSIIFLIPIIITTFFYILSQLFLNLKKRYSDKILLIVNLSFILIFTTSCYYFQKDRVEVENVSDNYANTVLDAYNKILINNLPYTYLVVNDSRKFVLNNNKHFLMSYYDFFTNYLDRDLIFNRYKNDEEELKKNPDYVLPNSVYVFTYDCAITDDEILLKDGHHKASNKLEVFCKINIILDELRDRGRVVKEFYRKRNIIVYEIENVENASEITDLMSF